jgi:glutamyl-tRNA synthetase
MIRLFDVANVHTSAAAFNPEKLLWLNQHYLKTAEPQHVAHHLSFHLGQGGIDPVAGPDPVEVVMAQRERAKTLTEMASLSAFFYKDVEAYESKDAQSHLKAEALAPLTELRERLAGLEVWTGEAIHAAVNAVAEARGLKLGKIAQPVRVAVAGRAVSPPIDVTLALLGRDKTLARLDRALDHIRRHSPAA